LREDLSRLRVSLLDSLLSRQGLDALFCLLLSHKVLILRFRAIGLMRYQLNFLRFELILWPLILLTPLKGPLLAWWQGLNQHLARHLLGQFSMGFEDLTGLLCCDSVERKQVLRRVVRGQMNATLISDQHGGRRLQRQLCHRQALKALLLIGGSLGCSILSLCDKGLCCSARISHFEFKFV